MKWWELCTEKQEHASGKCQCSTCKCYLPLGHTDGYNHINTPCDPSSASVLLNVKLMWHG